MKLITNVIYMILLCFISISCANYKHIPKNINKTSDKGKEGLWVIKNDTMYVIIFVRYKDDIEHGKYKEYYHNGQIAISGRYRNGEKIHLWKHYFNDGSRCKKINHGGCVVCRRSVLINHRW